MAALLGVLFVAQRAQAQLAAPAAAPLLRELAVRTDTARYLLSRHTVAVQGEPHLYFYYRHADETAELELTPAQPGRPLRLVRSAEFQVLDSLAPTDGGASYRTKIRFRDLTAARFLRLTVQQPADSVGRPPRSQTVALLPLTRTTLAFRPTDTELFVGEEKVFELNSNHPRNVRPTADWTRGQDLDYRLSLDGGALRLHVLPNALGARTLTVRAQTEQPFLTPDRRLTYALPPLRQEFTVRASRLRFLAPDRKDVVLDEAARRRGVELVLDNARAFELRRTYRLEEQEEPGGALIAEVFTRQFLSNDRVLCWLRAYNTHRLQDGYLYLKDGDQARAITNLSIAPKTAVTAVSVRHRGGDWSPNLTVNPGETVDVRLEGESLLRGRFHVEDAQTVPADSSVRTDAALVLRVAVPLSVDKRRLSVFNAGQATGFALAVREFQRPHALDFVGVSFGEAPRPLPRLAGGPVLYPRVVRDVVFSFNPAAIDADPQLFGKQYLTFDIRTQNSKGELIELRTAEVLVCPDASSVRGAFYQDKQCQVGPLSLNSLLATRKTYELDDWSTVLVTVRHTPGQYQEPGYSQKLELVLQRKVKFDIDVSFPAGLLTKRQGESGYGSFGGISLATLAQFSFYHPEKINRLRPYKVGAGFVALNAFNLSQDAAQDRDLGLVVLGSVYPTRREARLTFPLYVGGGYLLSAGKWFYLLGPGIGVRL